MIQPLNPFISVAFAEFGALSWVASSVDASLQLSSADENIGLDNLPSSIASTLKASSSTSTQLFGMSGVRSGSSSSASLHDAIVGVVTVTSTLLAIPTPTEMLFTSAPPIAVNSITADSSIILSRPSWTPDSTSLSSAYSQSTIPLALPIVTAVLLGIILLILLVFSILLCQRVRSTDHDVEGGIRVTVGRNKLQHIQLPAMPMSPLVKDF